MEVGDMSMDGNLMPCLDRSVDALDRGTSWNQIIENEIIQEAFVYQESS